MKLNETALLIHVIPRKIGFVRKDKSLTEQLLQDSGIKRGKISTTKRVLEEPLKLIAKKDAEIKAMINSYTNPWDDGGRRIISIRDPRDPNKILFQQYEMDLRRLIDERNELVQELKDKLHEWIDQDKVDLGPSWKAEDYPDEAKISKKFWVEVRPPEFLPDTDFRVNLPNGMMDEIRQRIEEDLQNKVNGIIRLLFAEIHELFFGKADEDSKSFFERMDESEPNLRSAFFDKVGRLINEVRNKNLTNNPDLNEVIDRIESQIARFDSETLNVNSFAREAVKTELSGLLQKVDAYL